MRSLDMLRDRLNALSLRAKLGGGFAALVILALLVGGVSRWGMQRTLSTIDTYIEVHERIAGLGQKSGAAMLRARRYENGFLLHVRELGFWEARSRYATLLRAETAEIHATMEEIRRLASDPTITAQTRRIEEAAGRYEAGFLRVVALNGLLGREDTGLEGKFREKAHEIEGVIGQYRDDRLMRDLLSLRRLEKDFILRGRDQYLREFADGVKTFGEDLARAGIPPAQSARLARQADEYREMLDQYARLRSAIRDETARYVTAVNEIEPLLEQLGDRTGRTAAATRASMRDLARTTGWMIAAASFCAVLAGLAVSILISRKVIRSVRECMDFAGRIAQGELGTRMPPGREVEFRTLSTALNGMADALQAGRSLQERRAAELLEANEALEKEIAERRRFEEELEHQSTHDALTGLPNRTLLHDRIEQAILHAQRYHRKVSVMLLGLDRFKFINAALGSDMGDELLRTMAHRLGSCIRSVDTVARHGGDDYCIVLFDQRDSEDAALVARKVRNAVSRPLAIGGHDLVVTCSAGISIFPKDGREPLTLLKNAETAMYRAKELGRDSFRFYSEELNERVVAHMTMEKYLHRALEREELFIHYQPQADLNTGRITGIEALLRWRNPDLGLVPPARFIPLAEETGLIIPIGEWVMREACALNKAWQDSGLGKYVMAVNISARQFQKKDLVEVVGGILRETGLDPAFLELEIVESMVMHDVEGAMALLDSLKRLGVRLTMDDFGTGYSSLGYLKRFPFDKLKIDISFVRDITSDPESAAIARTIIAMARNLNLRVLAEGVETEGQLEYLRSHACDEMQGFYFSRPLPPQEMERLLQQQQPLRFPAKALSSPERTLLLVDDDAQALAALERVLMEDGYRILTAGSAEQGFGLLAVNRVGVVVCDYRMPGMDGIEFLARVKGLYPDVVRITLTGYPDMEAITAAINRGAVYKFLIKPWDDAQLRESVREAFRYFEAAAEAVGGVGNARAAS